MADPDSTPAKAPAFQFYPKDFITDSNVIVMSMAERGAYITLICLCWLDGTLPSDIGKLARLCGAPLSAFRKMWPAIALCFRPLRRGSDRLVHPRLERERQKQTEFREEQSRKGKASAAARNRRATESNRGSTVVDSRLQPKPNSSISYLLSPISYLQTAVKEPTAADARSRHPIYRSDRFVVFDWQLQDLSQMLGPHVDAFRLDEFFDALTQRSRAEGLVIPKSDVWAWLQAEVLTEAKRRGLPMAGTAPVRDKDAEIAAQNALVLAKIQQDRENRSRYAGR